MPLYLSSISLALSLLESGYHTHARAVKAMLAGDGLPERSTNLVALHLLLDHMPGLFLCHLTYTLARLKVNLYTYTQSVHRFLQQN